ncbi:MAG TPA: SDR family NAD(P)-dependent oxidoreductase [Burkholderiaceae bacterium]|nr:SDR family NAD(P)-dependent oxidoreductase [Burkholderiaceae bacterium]
MPNRYDLAGKVCLVTGGAKGIGHAIATLLSASGARVHVWDRQTVAIVGVDAEVVDLTQPAAIAAALARQVKAGVPDVLVNDAGYLGVSQGFLEHPPDDWQRIMAVNLLGTMQVTQAVAPHMVRARRGRIVNLGSLAGKEGLANLAAYSAASAGVIAFTKAISRELVGHNVFVNCVAPGPIDTDMIRGLGPDAVRQMIADSPMKRLGTVDEVAHLVAWLCSDASRFNTGAVFDMSGGRARY